MELHRIRTLLYYALGENHPGVRSSDVRVTNEKEADGTAYVLVDWITPDAGLIRDTWRRADMERWASTYDSPRDFVRDSLLPRMEALRKQHAAA